jgi:large subunit ribosomal protein L25
MAEVQLTARRRPEAERRGSGRKARRAGRVPAILYGRGGANAMLEVGARDLRRALTTAAGANVVIRLEIDGVKDGSETVMVRQIQIHPVTHAPIHADLVRIDVARKVRVRVPVETAGAAPGVAEGGILTPVLREIEVECLPTAIPSALRADVSTLAIGQSIHVRDLAVPAGVAVLVDAGETVVTVLAPKTEEAAPAAAAPAEPERIGEKKEEGEAAEGAEAAPAEKTEKAERPKKEKG